MRSKLRRALTIAAVGCFGCVTTCLADEPIVSLITPPGLQRGTEVELLITGARIADAKELLFYEPGIEVTSLAAEGDNKVKVKLMALIWKCPKPFLILIFSSLIKARMEAKKWLA